jgi:hypothetical protein
VDIPTAAPDTQQTTARRRGGCGAPLPRWARTFIASVMLITVAAALITHDLLAVWSTQTRLELDAVHMAAAGVEFLPGAPARATLAAAHSAALCGLSPSEVVRAAATFDGMSFNVAVRGTAPVLLLRLLGVAGVNVTALATATVRPSATPRKSGGPMVLSGLSVGMVCRDGARPRGAARCPLGGLAG